MGSEEVDLRHLSKSKKYTSKEYTVSVVVGTVYFFCKKQNFFLHQQKKCGIT